MTMNSNDTLDYENTDSPTFDTPFTRIIKFIILIVCLIPSGLCYLIIFYYFIRLRELRTKISNHVVICLLVCNFLILFIELPITLIYLHLGHLTPSSYSLCQFWIFLNYSLFPCTCWIMTTASIQRYFLIFHKHLINSHLKHYIPIISPLVLLFIWYIFLLYIYRCEEQFDYTQVWCSGACYLYDITIGTIDWIITCFLPIILTVIWNILLIVRVVYQKYKVQRGQIWRKTRKLTIQLLSISFLFLSIYLPVILIGLIRVWINPSFLLFYSVIYFAYSIYLVPILMPFVCLISLPEIVKQMKKLCYHRNEVQPMRNRHQQLAMITFSRRQIQPTRQNI